MLKNQDKMIERERQPFSPVVEVDQAGNLNFYEHELFISSLGCLRPPSPFHVLNAFLLFYGIQMDALQ